MDTHSAPLFDSGLWVGFGAENFWGLLKSSPDCKKYILASKALPIVGTSYYFRVCSEFLLLYAAYDFSYQSRFEAIRLSLPAFVFQVPVYILVYLEIHRWPGSSSSLVRAITRRYYVTVLKVDRNAAGNAMLLWSAALVMLVELVSILLCRKMRCNLDGAHVSSTQVNSS